MNVGPAGRSRHPNQVLCSAGSVLLLLLASLALALLLVLARLDAAGSFWQDLGLTGLFIYLVVLTVAAPQCRWAWSPETAHGGWLLFWLVQVVVIAFTLAVIAGADWLRPLQLQAHADPHFFVLRNLGISVVVGALAVRYLALQARWRTQVEAETRARLDSLQARIHPHFLFNALNTISSLIHERPDQAEQATMDLSDLLRTGLKEGSHHSLAEELDLVRGYLRIESLRLGDRLRVEWALADDLPLDFELPALMIQPLVENGVIHGIARLPEGGTLQIRGECNRGKRLRFVVENPVPEDHGAQTDGNRMALDNIRQRLELAFEEGGRLKTSLDNGSFRVELVVPVSD